METMMIQLNNNKAIKLLKDLEELQIIKLLKNIPNKEKSTLNKNNDLYPFKSEFLKCDNIKYILGEKINGTVTYNDGVYFINSDFLDISVWGTTRDEAEDAFAFTFNALYNNFAKEDDLNLTAKAKILKQKLLNLVINILE